MALINIKKTHESKNPTDKCKYILKAMESSLIKVL